MKQPAPVAAYLDQLRLIRNFNAGTPETSFYPAISTLFNAVGRTLAPAVFCLNHVSGKRAGIPDFGLFERPKMATRGETPRKALGGETPQWREGIAPDRG